MKLTTTVLDEYLQLKQDADEISKRLEEIRQACKERGSFSTNSHVCIVSGYTKVAMAPLVDVIHAISVETLQQLGLIREIKIINVRVARIEKFKQTKKSLPEIIFP